MRVIGLSMWAVVHKQRNWTVKLKRDQLLHVVVLSLWVMLHKQHKMWNYDCLFKHSLVCQSARKQTQINNTTHTFPFIIFKLLVMCSFVCQSVCKQHKKIPYILLHLNRMLQSIVAIAIN
jgi:hypothetical protein